MSSVVPAMTSKETDNNRGVDVLKEYNENGQGTGVLKIVSHVDRGDFTRKLSFAKLEVCQPHPQQHIFTLLGAVANVGDIDQ